MKNKECVHTWANDKNYTNQYEKAINMRLFIIWLNSIEPNYEENSIKISTKTPTLLDPKEKIMFSLIHLN
jgi:hypothetical protein